MDQIAEEGPQGKMGGEGRARGREAEQDTAVVLTLFSLTLCFAQIITDVIGNPEEERRAEFYQQPWAQEAVGRHIFAKVGSVLCWRGAPLG